MTLSLERKITVGFALSMAVTLVIAFAAWWNNGRLGGMFRWVDHTHHAISDLETVMNGAQAVQIESQRFVIAADPASLERWSAAVQRTRASLADIQSSVPAGAARPAQLDQMNALLKEEITLTSQRHDLRQNNGLEAAALEVSKEAVRQVVDRMAALVQEMKARESAALAERTTETQSAVRAASGLIFATAVAAVLLGAAALYVVRRELSQLKIAESALQKSSVRVQDLYDNAPCGYHSCDREGVFLEVNETELKWLGYTREELIGRKHFTEVLTEASRTKFLQLFPRYVEEGKVANVEFDIVRKDGTLISALLNATAMRDGAGQFVSSRTTLYNITERKKAEEERDRYFNLTRDLLCIASFDGKFRRLNPAWSKTLGYTHEELMAGPLHTWVHPDDRARTAAEAARLFAGAESVQFETRYRCRDGSYRWFHWSAVTLPSERLIFASARDITDEKRLAEAHIEFHALFDSLPGLYLVMKPDLSIVAASDAFLEGTRRKREEIMGKNVFTVFPDNPGASSVANLTRSFQRVLETASADTMAILRYDIPQADGGFEERYWSPVNAPVFGPDRKIQYVIHRVEDVTEFIKQKRTLAAGADGELHAKMERMEGEVFKSSQQVELANERLRAANQELEAFSYSVSHDLRAPLRHIDGFSGLLQKKATVLDDQGRRYLQVISESARRMGRLIDDLLSFSRIARSHLSLVDVDHDALVAAVVREGRYERTGDAAVVWEIEPLPRAPGDSAMLRQVWVNLIDNAVKYSGKTAQPRVTIGSRAASTASEHVYYVRDNGVGFDMQYVGKLFGVFQRLHNPAEFDGTGIGLANVQRIIVRHGGRVWAEGEVGVGATFYFSLPAPPAPGGRPPSSAPLV